MATREDIYAAIKNADAAGDSDSVRKLGDYLKTMDAAPAAPAPSTYLDRLKSNTQALGGEIKDVGLGALRGAAGIGATLMYPVDKATDLVMGDRKAPAPTLSSLITGTQAAPLSRNEERRQGINDSMGTLGADTNSVGFKAGKIGAEIAGTAGAGGVLGEVAGPAITRFAPQLGTKIANALASNGFSIGAPAATTLAGRAGDLAIRSGAGALAGGAQVGLVSPEDAGTGALIGAALPGAAKLVGMAGNALSGAPLSAGKAAAVDAARQAGFTLPPTEINPSALNQLAEGLSGKIKTSQAASAKNQPVVNSMAAKALNLPADTPLTQEVLDGVRKEAGKAYQAVASLPAMDAAGANLPASVTVKTFHDPLTLSPKSEVNPADLVQQWKQANADASGYFRAYARDANPETLTKAKAAAASAKQIDSFLDSQLSKNGQSDLLDNLKAARVQLAKSYSVENALNGATGDVSAQKLGKQLEKGKPLSGELKTAAEAAQAFPKAMQTLSQNYNATGPLDFAVGALMAHDPGSNALKTVLGHAVAPIAFPAARIGTRAAILSEPYQNLTADAALRNRLQALAGPAAFRAIPSTSRK